MNQASLNNRKKVAKEAAILLYTGAEKEYKQAKIKAAKTFGVKFLPTNLEVALELDRTAEENEGPNRQKSLIRKRTEALRLMRLLGEYNPLLVGSVWRGTAHWESDIDIVAFHDDPEDILRVLKQNGIKVAQTEWSSVTKRGEKKGSFHIYAYSPDRGKVEIRVSNPEESGRRERCEIYGDKVIGLRIKELEKMLREDSAKRFLPA